jgi:hypothetical protein
VGVVSPDSIWTLKRPRPGPTRTWSAFTGFVVPSNGISNKQKKITETILFSSLEDLPEREMTEKLQMG